MIGLVDEAEDGGLQFGDGSEDAALEPAPGELGKEALHRVEPGGRCRREVESPARMSGEPLEYFGMLVGRVVVDDGVDRRWFGDLGLDGVKETDELLMPMAWQTAADQLAIQDVECSEQGRGAVAF